MQLSTTTLRIHTATFCTVLAALIAGCGSDEKRPVDAPPVSPPTAKVSTATSMESYGAALTNAKSDIDQALTALDKLTDPSTTDLRAASDAFNDRVARIVQQSDALRRESAAMRNSRNAYFAQWEDKMLEIDNPTIRATAEQRRKRLRDAYENITTTSLAARDAYDPFIRDLQDIRKFLAPDLSRQSVSMLGDIHKKCVENGNVVKQKIDAIITELKVVDSGQR